MGKENIFKKLIFFFITKSEEIGVKVLYEDLLIFKEIEREKSFFILLSNIPPLKKTFELKNLFFSRIALKKNTRFLIKTLSKSIE